MKRLALLAVLCLLSSMPVGASEFSDTKALAEQGKAIAQNKLGNMYTKGEGVPQDYAEAVKWYRKAADQGYAAAQFNLGFMCDKGEGVPQDYAEAYVWYSLAATSGYRNAKYLRRFIAMKLSSEDLAAAQKRAAKLFEEIQQRKE
jgi:TPR repeat protein